MKNKLTRKQSLISGYRFGHKMPDYAYSQLEKGAAAIDKTSNEEMVVPQIFLTNKARGTNAMKPKTRIRQKH